MFPWAVCSEAEMSSSRAVPEILVIGAGAAGLAGLKRLAGELAGKQVAVILSGANIDAKTLQKVLTGQL